MTKKKCLGLSSLFNFLTLLLVIFSASQIKVALDTGATVKGIAALAEGYPLVSVFNVFGGAILLCFVAYVVKLVAERREKNCTTLLSLLLDGAILAFFYLLAQKMLLSGQFLANPLMLTALVLGATTVVLDLASFPAERWG